MTGEKIKTAAFLIRCALLRPAIKATETNYREAIVAWETDPQVKEATESICKGMGMRVLDVNENGIYLASEGADSPFRPRLTNISSRLSNTNDRQLFGLVLTAVMALFYQSSAHLLSDLTPTIAVREVREKVIEIAEARLEELDIDEMSDSSDIDEACTVLLRPPATGPTEGGQIKSGTLHRMVELVFTHLEEESYVRRRTNDDGGSYSALRKFRIHAREFAVMEAFDTVRRILEQKDVHRQMEVDHA